MIKINGFCPMGCGETLRVNRHARAVECGAFGCLNPFAVHEILSIEETSHIVWFTEVGWTIEHPLRERVELGRLSKCPVQERVGRLEYDQYRLGAYRTSDGKVFEEIV